MMVHYCDSYELWVGIITMAFSKSQNKLTKKNDPPSIDNSFSVIAAITQDRRQLEGVRPNFSMYSRPL